MSETNHNIKILIAEDEKPLAKALSLKLKEEGLDVDVANDGEVALDMIHKNNYDLILMDVMMPGYDGFSILEKMKAEKNETPVIIMTNLSQDSDRGKATVAGAVHYFVKGDNNLSDIVEYVKKFLKI